MNSSLDAFRAFAALPRQAPAAWRAPAARDLLARPGAEATLVDALNDPDSREAALQVARIQVADTDGLRWYLRAVWWLRAAHASWSESAAFCADVAWTARRQGRSPAVTIPAAALADPDPGTARTLRHLHLTGLRYEFQCAALHAALPADTTRLNPYIRALDAFAALGQSQPAGVTAMRRLLADPDAAGDAKVLHTLLHGLWLGECLPQQAEMMLELLARPLFAARTDPIVLYREARAHRKLGHLERALEAVDRAFAVLEPSSTDVHADLVRERGLITLARDLTTANSGVRRCA